MIPADLGFRIDLPYSPAYNKNKISHALPHSFRVWNWFGVQTFYVL